MKTCQPILAACLLLAGLAFLGADCRASLPTHHK